jgi:hypothetical protein
VDHLGGARFFEVLKLNFGQKTFPKLRGQLVNRTPSL